MAVCERVPYALGFWIALLFRNTLSKYDARYCGKTTCVEPMLAVLLPATGGFVACSVTTSTSVQVFAARSSPVRAHWMDHLKFGGSTPTFDVLEKTKEYAACKTAEEFLPLYADDYVSIIGPISGEEVRDTQKGFNIPTA